MPFYIYQFSKNFKRLLIPSISKMWNDRKSLKMQVGGAYLKVSCKI